jgi:hypothetical protein
LALRVLINASNAQRKVVVMAKNEQQTPNFQSDEEMWFSDHGKGRKRPLRQSPSTPPPPPIGDDLADRWFR